MPTWDTVGPNPNRNTPSVPTVHLIKEEDFKKQYCTNLWKRVGKTKELSWNNYFEDIGSDRKYKGEWNKTTKKPEGLGIIQFKDGSEYRGQFYDDKFNGRGQMKQGNGSIYWGDWKDGKANGFGVYYCAIE